MKQNKVNYEFDEGFDRKFYYDGDDLGTVYTAEKTNFKLWAPTAEQVVLRLFEQGDGECLIEEYVMQQSGHGIWEYECLGDMEGRYYTYLVKCGGVEKETIDPYAKACGVNGKRGMIIDLKKTDPDGFSKDHGPELSNNTDAVICEISIADTTADASCHAKYPGKYLGLTESNTVNDDGMATGTDHLKELGITHVQIMPSFDFGSIDESDLSDHPYNWGYDPQNYNVPEGSFAIDPYHGEVRIREYKQMVQHFHQNGIGVIMDVVFNHTHNIEDSCFQKTVPDYFYRKDGERYSDASACGNEIASERAMVRKYIVDSVCYWAKEYHIDGYRFDLMGCLDIETMQQVHDELKKINPDIIVYGEGWTGGDSTLPVDKRSLKVNIPKLQGVGAFSDDIRDNIRGHVFYDDEKGYVSGVQGKENAIRYSVAGACHHPQVDYKSYEYTVSGAWAKNPVDTINYVSCHDNLTLWDKMSISCKEEDEETRTKMCRLAASIVFTSQGVPFFLQGEEFLRSKPIEGRPGEVSSNSYNLPLYTNGLRYDMLSRNKEVYEYYKGLIAFRKAHKGLRMATQKEVEEHLVFFSDKAKNVVSFIIQDEKEQIFVAYNANKDAVSVSLPEGEQWKLCIDGTKAGCDTLQQITGTYEIPGIACIAAYRS